jgi:hypothetical protein
VNASRAIEQSAVSTSDPHGDHASPRGDRHPTDGRAPRRIRDRPIVSAHVRDLAGRKDHQCAALSKPQMRRPQAGQAALCSTRTFERVNEEAEIAQLWNAGQQVIREKAHIVPRTADQIQQK